jgi:D-alanyl-D-alanine carboxypeptidase
MELHPKSHVMAFKSRVRSRARNAAVVAAAALVVVATSCGSDSSSATPAEATSPPSSSTAATSTAPAPTDPAPTTSPSNTAPVAETDSLMLQGPLPTSAIDPQSAASLQAVLDKIVADGAPDAIAAVITPDGTWSGAAGTDGPNGRAATADDSFAIASISKVFTGALIMRLVEQGKIDLDHPLADYLEGVDTDTNNATVRQTLEMWGGFGDTPSSAFDEVYADPGRVWATADVVSKIGAPLTPAGTEYHYSNPGYKLLGFAAEQATGKSLGTAMGEAVLDPAGASEIWMQDPDHLTPQPWALPLEGSEGPLDLAAYGQGGALPCLSDSTFSLNAAGMASTASGLATWGWQLFSGQILQPQSLAAMMTFDSDLSGLGVEMITDFGVPAYGHAGSKPGYASLLTVLPETNTVIVMFINNQEADVYSATGSLLKAL